MRPLKVALLFWGLTRSLNVTLPSIREQIFEPLDAGNATYDVFLHTYSIEGTYSNPRNGVFNATLDNEQWKLLEPGPGRWRVEDQAAFDARTDFAAFQARGDPWRNNFVSLHNFIRALHSLSQVTRLLQRSGRRYDAVVFLRPDVRYVTPLNVTLLRGVRDGEYLSPDFHQWSGCNDRFGIGTQATMVSVGTRWDVAQAYSRRHVLHSEAFLRDYLRSRNITSTPIPFYFQRVRANGVVNSLDAELVRDLRRAGCVSSGSAHCDWPHAGTASPEKEL